MPGFSLQAVFRLKADIFKLVKIPGCYRVGPERRNRRGTSDARHLENLCVSLRLTVKPI